MTLSRTLVPFLVLSFVCVASVWAAQDPDQVPGSRGLIALDAAPILPPSVEVSALALPMLDPSSMKPAGRSMSAASSEGSRIVTDLQSQASALGLAALPALRLDYIQHVPGLAGLSDRVYFHFV